MGNHQVAGFGRVGRARFERTIDGHAVTSEGEQVEVELARTPASAFLPPERSLDRLQRHQEGQRAGLRVRTGRHVQGDDRISELRLVSDADRGRGVEARDAVESSARQRGEAANARLQRRLRPAYVRPQPDVGPDSPAQRNASRS